MARQLGRQRVRDLLELVGGAGVLGLRGVVEVDVATVVDRHVLEDRPEGVRRLPDLGLCGRRETDRLGVAAAFEVEHAVVAPAVLVVADQQPRRVGGKRGLPRSREPEEDRHVLPVLRDVCRAVHGQDALEGEPVVQHREDRLLDLAGIERAADHELGARRMQHDERPGTRPVHRRVGFDLGRVQHQRVGPEVRQLGFGGIDEERLGKERVIRTIGDDANGDPVLRVCAGKRVDHVHDLLLLEEPNDLLAELLEALVAQLLVAVPPDPVFGARLAHDELVLRRATRVPAGVDDERPAFRDPRVASLDGVLVEHGRGRVPDDRARRMNAVGGEIQAPADVHGRHRIFSFLNAVDGKRYAPGRANPPYRMSDDRSFAR